MFIPQSYHAYYAYEAIALYLEQGEELHVDENEIPEELKSQRGCFVSVFVNGELRGCMGSAEPFTNNLLEEIIKNSIHSIVDDSRFESITKEDLPNLSVQVDIVGNLHPVYEMEEALQIDVKTYGVVVEDKQGRTGLLLPNQDGVENAYQAVRVAMHKGDIKETDPNKLKLYKFKIKSFQ